ncbi:MAG: Transcriptional regulator [Variovorax sp.]|nr:Transcriptional regulator [Variovorax sp.]
MGTLGTIQDMAVFVEVARARSLTEAGKTLSVAPSTLSRRLTAIESAMGVRLLQRSTRRIELTEAGADYFARSEALTLDALRLHDAFRAVDQQLSGRLIVAAPAECGLGFLSGIISEFIRRHPKLELELNLSPRHATEEPSRHDVALRLGPVDAAAATGALVRAVGTVQQRLYASERYLAKSAPLQAPTDLTAHNCIVEGREPGMNLWRLQRDSLQTTVKVGGNLATNNVSLRASLASEHFGIAVLPVHVATRLSGKGALVPVLTGWDLPLMAISAVVSEKSSLGKARVFVEWLESRLRRSAAD